MSRQVVMNLDGKPHIYQEAVRFNTEIWIDKKDGTIEKMCCRDLGPVNEAGLLAEERTGIFPKVSQVCDKLWKAFIYVNNDLEHIEVAVYGKTKQQVIDTWNRRTK